LELTETQLSLLLQGRTRRQAFALVAQMARFNLMAELIAGVTVEHMSGDTRGAGAGAPPGFCGEGLR
jgi:hypothetical protein